MVNSPSGSKAASLTVDPAGLLDSVPTFGVGLMYNPALADFVQSDLETFDYLEITPDMFWTDQGREQSPRFVELDSTLELLEWVNSRRPIMAHNISLSIGSAGLFDLEYIEQIGEWHRRYDFPWHSDHLSMVQYIDEAGQVCDAGLAVPFPYDYELLDQVAGRIAHVQEVIPAPFLVENNVYFVVFPEQEMTETEFLNRLTERTGCGLLLDIHNLYANALNHHYDPIADYVDHLDLDRVIEIHIAGGNEFAGMYTDSHSGPCPESVWELLDIVVPRTPNLRGITFEFHDSYYPLLKTEGIRAELGHAQRIWNQHRQRL